MLTDDDKALVRNTISNARRQGLHEYARVMTRLLAEVERLEATFAEADAEVQRLQRELDNHLGAWKQ